MGVDQFPDHIRNSHILTGNDLGKLGNAEKFPEQSAIDAVRHDADVAHILAQQTGPAQTTSLHQLAQNYLEAGDVDMAWRVLLAAP
jgi:hypothetical protein